MNGEVQLIVTTKQVDVTVTLNDSLTANITSGDSSCFGASGLEAFYTIGSKIEIVDESVGSPPYPVLFTRYVTAYDSVTGEITVDVPFTSNVTAVTIAIYVYTNLPKENYLDLFENESISQNWKFQDLNNFTSQGAFSREFRVPYSLNNQEALGALFDVNVTAGTENYFHYKLPAEIRVDTLPIATGYVRVRKIYKNLNRINEVELAFYAETPDLVRNIGEKKLADIADLINLNETIDYDNVTTPNARRIWTLLERGELWSEANEVNTRSLFDFDNPVYPVDLTPALRYDYLFEEILKDAGFELVAGSLLNILSTYYMPWLNSKTNIGSDSFNSYFFRVYNNASAGIPGTSTLINMNTEVFDNNSNFNTGTASYVTPSGGYYTFRFRNKFSVTGSNNISYFLDIDGDLIFLDNFSVVNNQIIDFTYRIGIDAGSVVQLKLKRNEPSSVTLVAGDGTLDTSIWELVQTDLYYGQSLYYDLNAPNAKQIDFVTDIIKMHNCIIVSDRSIPNKIYIVPQNSYLGSGNILDWTPKLDTSKDIVLSSTADLQKSKFQFTYTAGEDIISKQYKNVNRVYGDYEAVGYTINPNTPSSDFATGDQKIQLTMQSTPCGVVNGSTVVIPMFINEQLEFVAPSMRCLFHAGDVNIELFNDNIGFPTVTTTPVLNHYSSVIADLDDFDLNWAPEVPPYGINANPYNNLFNLYWRSYMNALYSPEARIMEASFALDLKDIVTFQFSDKVWIQDSYWRILEVNDYKVGNYESTKVKLLKFVEDTEDCSLTPSTISTNGEVNFVDGNGDPATSIQDCCTRYGYNWDEANAICWAFTPNGQSRPNTISGSPTTPAVRKFPVAEQTRAVLNSVINGESITIDVDNKNMLAVGENLTLTTDVQGSTLLGKNVDTNLPGIHIGGGYRDGLVGNSAYTGWAQHGTVILHKQINFAASPQTDELYVEGVVGTHINIPEDSLWSCILNFTIKDIASTLYESSVYHFSIDKQGGVTVLAAINQISVTGAIPGVAIVVGVDVVTNPAEARINVTMTGTPTGNMVGVASVEYQQHKTT